MINPLTPTDLLERILGHDEALVSAAGVDSAWYWPDVLIMAIAAILGGIGGAGTARKLGRTAVRRIVIVIGFGMAVSLFIRK